MKLCAMQHRVVVTADLDFPRLLATVGASGPGLILLRGGDYSESESVELLKVDFSSAREACAGAPRSVPPTTGIVNRQFPRQGPLAS